MEKLKTYTSEDTTTKEGKKSADSPVKNNLAPFKEDFGGEINEGTFANIYELTGQENKETEFLVKAGKTEKYTPPILKWLKLNLPREEVSKLLVKIFGPQLKIQPDMEFIENGLAEYTLIKKYFGTDRAGDAGQSEIKTDSETSQEADEKIRAQVIDEIKDENSEFFKDLFKSAGGKEGVEKIVEVLTKNQDYNFLPKEHLVVGHPASLSQEKAKELQAKGEKLPLTYYIIQERIRGEGVAHLFEMDDKALSQHPAIAEKLLTFLILVKKMYNDTGKLIDTRPEEVGKHPLEWFRKTGNIMVDKESDRVSFVDTRWLWDEKSGLGSGGVNLIKLLGVRSIDKSINKYTKLLLEIDMKENPSPSQLKNQEKPRIISGEEDTYNKIRESWDKEKLALVDKQLETVIMVEVKDRQGRPIKIEGRFVNSNPENTAPKQTLAIVPGWASSCGGVADFARHMALSGERPVVTISMPGTGQSDNVPEEWLAEKDFGNEAFVVMQAIEKIRKEGGDLGGQEISVMGHSMGGMVATEIACQNPEKVKTLILAHTAGVEKEKSIGLASRFSANAVKESLSYLTRWVRSGFDKEWGKKVMEHFGVAVEIGKNVLTDKDRLMQHLIKKEVEVMSAGGIEEMIKNFEGNLMIVSGTDEHLFSLNQSAKLKELAVKASSVVSVASNLGKHSDVIARPDQEAILVEHQLDKFGEKK
jgi:pimeloyl-ACP methyl ester carboxylesterase